MKTNPKHVQMTEKLADLLLKEYEKRLESGTISDTGMANLQRLLRENGWVIEDEALASVKAKLTANVDPTRFQTDDDEDEAVIAKIA
jgi:hypothetical protein